MVSTQVYLNTLLETQLKEYVRNVSSTEAVDLLSRGEYAQKHSLLICPTQNSGIRIVRATTNYQGIRSIEELFFTVQTSTKSIAKEGFKFVSDIDKNRRVTIYSSGTFVKLLDMMEESERRILYSKYYEGPTLSDKNKRFIPISKNFLEL